jgi:hypothetical protein
MINKIRKMTTAAWRFFFAYDEVTITVSRPDACTFSKSQPQIIADMQRALKRGNP